MCTSVTFSEARLPVSVTDTVKNRKAQPRTEPTVYWEVNEILLVSQSILFSTRKWRRIAEVPGVKIRLLLRGAVIITDNSAIRLWPGSRVHSGGRQTLNTTSRNSENCDAHVSNVDKDRRLQSVALVATWKCFRDSTFLTNWISLIIHIESSLNFEAGVSDLGVFWLGCYMCVLEDGIVLLHQENLIYTQCKRPPAITWLTQDRYSGKLSSNS